MLILRCIAVLIAVGAATAAFAQLNGFIGVQGQVTPGHCVKWLNKDTVVDAGHPCSGGTCTNKLNFSVSCNSQYIGVL